ncbi:hypothetical protein [Pseudomonas asplenii]|uniref:hypothetical protein n=1 Tax=Pseudomonas asplenii TaxID=53407 RepID=UPI001396259C|nr:hypothetical protein [Pseudomonas fuscovaginae]
MAIRIANMPLAWRDRRSPKIPDEPLITHPRNPLYPADHSVLLNIREQILLNPDCTNSHQAWLRPAAQGDLLTLPDKLALSGSTPNQKLGNDPQNASIHSKNALIKSIRLLQYHHQ